MLKFALFEFKTKTLNSFYLPPYKGSTFRGAFGYTIKKIACVKKSYDCTGCILKEKCIYSYIFETPPPPDSSMMKKYTAAPHPFVIEPPLENKTLYEKGVDLNFALVLIGKGIDYLPYFVYAFEEMGREGIGSDRGRYEITEVINRGVSEGVTIYTNAKKLLSPVHIFTEDKIKKIAESYGDVKELTLSFLTPARVKYEEKFVDSLEFHILMRNLLRRISLLTYFHCNGTMELEFKDIIEKAKGVVLTGSELIWSDWERYSSRQKNKMKMGGLMGKVNFKGEIGEFITFILTGKYVHLGKGATFGLGKYEVS